MLGEPRRLDGDIGYVEVTSFAPHVAEVRDEVRAKMSAVADARALIFDLRENGGGLPETVAFLTSYVGSKEPVQLGSTYKRATNKTEELFTDPSVPGSTFGSEKPVYVLTSHYTFSAPESFAYDLQARKRAIIVGEKTGGGADAGDVVSLGHGFSAFIPDTRVIHPVTKTDWEGVGVKPDVEVPADKALETAHKLALERVRGRP